MADQEPQNRRGLFEEVSSNINARRPAYDGWMSNSPKDADKTTSDLPENNPLQPRTNWSELSRAERLSIDRIF